MKKFFALLALTTLVLVNCGGDPVEPVAPTIPPVPESFVDPTASLDAGVTYGRLVYIAPFAQLQGQVSIGDGSNVQDNVLVTGPTSIGDEAILAHGCSVIASRIGAPGGKACFVGFNALVDGATVEPDAMVGILSRVGPGVTLHSGFRVLPGKNVATQDEADDPALGKVVPVTDADRAFMAGVLHVNDDLALGYAQLQAQDPDAVKGIGADPASVEDPDIHTPTLAGVPTLDPTFRNRIVGEVFLEDTLAQLSLAMGNRDSIRADEGGPFQHGPITQLGDEVTYHALEDSEITVGSGIRVGLHAVIHGGEDIDNNPPAGTHIQNNVTIGPRAVVFRSDVADDCIIGEGALIDASQLTAGTVVPDKTILIKNQNLGTVEW